MKFRELIEYNILLESLDSIIKQTKDIDPDTIKMYHKYALPDNNKSDRLLNHVLKMHRKGELKPWDSALVNTIAKDKECQGIKQNIISTLNKRFG